MASLIYDQYFKPWEIFGGKRPFFLRYAEVIADVIKDFKLKPIDQEMASPAVRLSEIAKIPQSSQMMAFIDPGQFGGKRFAHLHYRGDIYVLNSEQWRAFTGRVKDDMINRLKAADSISVEQFQDISDALDPIA
jgi:hypothetical protein